MYQCILVPKGNSLMSLIAKRLASAAASVLVVSLVSTAANAQIDVHNTDALNYLYTETTISNYTFSSSMILNSIDFGTKGFSNVLSYKIGNGGFQLVDNSLLTTTDTKGFQRIYLGALTVDANTVVQVKMAGTNNNWMVQPSSVNSASNVSFTGSSIGTGFIGHLTNSNLRVYNPGSTVPGASVAPEPGSIALLLTGGAALAGIALRRRRNAA
jgi:hypothetical protein